MSILKTQIEEFEAEILLSNDTQENEIIIEHNETIFNELKLISQKLDRQKSLSEAIACFFNNDSHEHSSIVETLNIGYALNTAKKLIPSTELLQIIDRIIEQFQEYIECWSTDNYKVQQRPVYLSPRDGLEGLIKNLKEINNQYWNVIASAVNRDVFVESEILEQQRLTPTSKENYDKYNTQKSRLDEYFVSRDINLETIGKIEQLRTELIELKNRFDTSGLPQEVAKFLKEINGTGGIATLELLTPEVMEWLLQKDLLQKYKVIRR